MEGHVGVNDCIDSHFTDLSPDAAVQGSQNLQARPTQRAEHSSQVMALQNARIVVCHCQLMPCCYQKSVIDTCKGKKQLILGSAKTGFELALDADPNFKGAKKGFSGIFSHSFICVLEPIGCAGLLSGKEEKTQKIFLTWPSQLATFAKKGGNAYNGRE